jgi:hypothetical protein
MKKVSDNATKVVNFIKQRPVHSRMFKKNISATEKSGGLAEEVFSTGSLS